MASAGSDVVLRDSRGRFGPGQAGAGNLNAAGINQYSPGHNVKRRIALAFEAELDERPICVKSFVQTLATAIKYPKRAGNPELLKLCKDLFLGSIEPNEPEQTPGGQAEARSEAHWLRLSDEFDARHAEHPGVVIEVEPDRRRGAE